jgi:predicted peptidase
MKKSNAFSFCKRQILPALLSVCIYSNLRAQDFSVYEKHFYNAPELNLAYRYLRPKTMDSSKVYPLLIFLHGAFSKGFDNELQLAIGGRFFMRDSVRVNYPAYVLFPQCPEADSWAYFETKTDIRGNPSDFRFPVLRKPTDVTAALLKLVDSLKAQDLIDHSRIYIGGLSQGGMGVLDLIARKPEVFAAAFSICGAGDVSTARKFAGKTALWIFHGEEDDVIPVHFSRQYYKLLKKLDADVRYSEYAFVKHNSWLGAFAEKELLSWMFSKKKD